MADLEAFEKATDALQEDLRNIRETREYSDMQVLLGDGTKERCHRIIMCMRCAFFRDKLKPGSEACNTGIVKMLDEPPEAVEALIDFIYVADYRLDRGHGVVGEILSHLDILKIARTYAMPELEELAAQNITTHFVKFPEAAAKAFPDIAGFFEQQNISWDRGWVGEWDSPEFRAYNLYHSFMDWVDSHRRLLMDKDTGDALEEKAPDLMEYLMEDEAEGWFEAGNEECVEWIERFNGPGSSGALKYTFECPNRNCRLIQDRFIGIVAFEFNPVTLSCNGCHHQYEYEKWMEFVQEPADEVNG